MNPGAATTSPSGVRIGQRADAAFQIDFEGRPLDGYPGETVAAVLLAAGIVDLRTAEDGEHRGLVCGIGVCWECRCVIDGRPNVRACMAEAQPGMTVARQSGLGS